MRVEEGTPRVGMSASRLLQVLLNLVMNAADAVASAEGPRENPGARAERGRARRGACRGHGPWACRRRWPRGCSSPCYHERRWPRHGPRPRGVSWARGSRPAAPSRSFGLRGGRALRRHAPGRERIAAITLSRRNTSSGTTGIFASSRSSSEGSARTPAGSRSPCSAASWRSTIAPSSAPGSTRRSTSAGVVAREPVARAHAPPNDREVELVDDPRDDWARVPDYWRPKEAAGVATASSAAMPCCYIWRRTALADRSEKRRSCARTSAAPPRARAPRSRA